jgi:4-amino-4-deoxy-L-arabinose transferase
MVISGDWVVPRLNGIRYFEKTPLGYWLVAASIHVFGENRFAVRFPQAVSTGISALLLFWLIRRFVNGYRVALLAAAAFLTCAEVFAVGVFNVLDSVLSMFLTAAMVSFFCAYRQRDPGPRVGFLALFGVACGLAFLTKGFLAFAVPVVAIVPFLLWERRGRDSYRLPWIPLLAALVIVLPWSILIDRQEPRFWHYFFWIEHIKRFTSDNPQHAEPFWYFVPYLVGGALPWAVVAPASFSRIKSLAVQNGSLVRFAICWLVFPFLFFSLSGGKIGTYILPCFPPFIILLSLGLERYFEERRERAFVIGVLVLSVLAGAGGVTLLLNETLGLLGSAVYSGAESWKWVIGTALLFIWFSCLVTSARVTNTRRRLGFFIAGWLPIMFAIHFLLPDQSTARKAPGAFLEAHAGRVTPSALLVSEGELAVAASWFYKRSDVYLLRAPGEFHWGLTYEDTKHRMLTVEQFETMLDKRGESHPILFAYIRNYETYRDRLPEPQFVATWGRFVLVQF